MLWVLDLVVGVTSPALTSNCSKGAQIALVSSTASLFRMYIPPEIERGRVVRGGALGLDLLLDLRLNLLMYVLLHALIFLTSGILEQMLASVGFGVSFLSLGISWQRVMAYWRRTWC
jgi:hypothetical protein